MEIGVMCVVLYQQDQVANSSGLEKIYTLTDGRTDIQKSDFYSEVALAKNSDLQAGIWFGS